MRRRMSSRRRENRFRMKTVLLLCSGSDKFTGKIVTINRILSVPGVTYVIVADLKDYYLWTISR